MKKIFSVCILAVFCLLITSPVLGQKTVGILRNDNHAFEGYTLITPARDCTVQLIDMDGHVVNSWEMSGNNNIVNHAKLLENGLLLRGVKGRNRTFAKLPQTHQQLELVDWEGDVVWEFKYSSDKCIMHHDFTPIYKADGSFTILAIAYENISNDKALDLGRDSAALCKKGYISMDKIIEIKPDLVTGAGEIIWEWKAVDHLVQDFDATKNNYGVVADNPQLFNFNYFKRNRKHKTINDWMHVNSVSYNEKLDQIMFGHHAAHQMVIIDHSTTTKEAASHSGGKYGKGGDILYRWGNPSSYDAKGKTVFQAIHDAHWIPEGLPDAGKVMMFDNGYQSKASKIRVISIPQSSPGVYDLESASTFTKQDWVYDNGKDFFSKDMGSAHQLPNGNFFINESITGRSFEVDKNNTILWEYKNPIVNSTAVEWDDVIVTEDNELKNAVFMSFRYAPDYSGFEGQEMTSGEPIETYLSVTKVTIPKGKKYMWQGEKYKKAGIYIVSGHYLDLVVE